MERDAIVEITEREATGGYRAEVRDLRTDDHIGVADVGDADRREARTPYRHVCKVRLPTDETARVRYDPDDRRIVVSAGDRTYYRHELPA